MKQADYQPFFLFYPLFAKQLFISYMAVSLFIPFKMVPFA